jgi:hypothetical protein
MEISLDAAREIRPQKLDPKRGRGVKPVKQLEDSRYKHGDVADPDRGLLSGPRTPELAANGELSCVPNFNSRCRGERM